MKLYTVQETSVLIRKKISTIYKDLIRRPWALPPRVKLPNCKGVFFKDVIEWMSGELPPVPAPSSNPCSTRKRGRPSHASKLIIQ